MKNIIQICGDRQSKPCFLIEHRETLWRLQFNMVLSSEFKSTVAHLQEAVAPYDTLKDIFWILTTAIMVHVCECRAADHRTFYKRSDSLGPFLSTLNAFIVQLCNDYYWTRIILLCKLSGLAYQLCTIYQKPEI